MTYTRRKFLQTGFKSIGSVMIFTYALPVNAGSFAKGSGTKITDIKEQGMPHISVKMFPGRTEEEKQRLARAIAEDVIDIIQCSSDSVSIAIEDVSPTDWKEEVYDPEIQAKPDKIYKKPGYSM